MRRAFQEVTRKFSVRQATPEQRRLVLGLIRERQPVTIQELYNFVLQRQPEDDPEASIPSMRYLKKVVLPDLAHIGKVERVHTKQVLTPEQLDTLKKNMGNTSRKGTTLSQNAELWVWRIRNAEPPAPAPEPTKPFGAEVGVGADFSHLNKRRQRAREEKIERDVEWLKELKQAREEALRES
ncbi:hypothetical protein BV20DRAFT_970833 [Pilatotrama ljubarskyi]|nr:hypothetical protein BV20DRAFT_970833 [Pilatotrama ljubarskyi]